MSISYASSGQSSLMPPLFQQLQHPESVPVKAFGVNIVKRHGRWVLWLESFLFHRPLSYLNSLFQPQIFYVFEKWDYPLGNNSTAFIALKFYLYSSTASIGVVVYSRNDFNPKNYKSLHQALFWRFLFIKQMYNEHPLDGHLCQYNQLVASFLGD